MKRYLWASVLFLAASGELTAAPNDVYVSSDKAKTYHTRLECLKRAKTPMVGPESAAVAAGMKKCDRCAKPKATSLFRVLSAIEKNKAVSK